MITNLKSPRVAIWVMFRVQILSFFFLSNHPLSSESIVCTLPCGQVDAVWGRRNWGEHEEVVA